MKYRVMIIDDERAIRSLLKNAIKWQDYDMEIVGEAESGIEAINTIDEIRPHLVFVDIRMPFMDGIEFSRLARERYPRLKIIVLTAFDEFEYARECISIGVSQYILKPVNREEVKAVLEKVRQVLEEEQGQEPDGQPEEPEEEGGVFSKMVSSPIFYILLVIVLVLLIVAIVLLVLNNKRKKKKAAEEAAAAAAAAEGDAAAILEQMPNFDFNKEILEFQNDRGMELKQHIRDFTEENPEISAQLLKTWLNGGGGE